MKNLLLIALSALLFAGCSDSDKKDNLCTQAEVDAANSFAISMALTGEITENDSLSTVNKKAEGYKVACDQLKGSVSPRSCKAINRSTGKSMIVNFSEALNNCKNLEVAATAIKEKLEKEPHGSDDADLDESDLDGFDSVNSSISNLLDTL